MKKRLSLYVFALVAALSSLPSMAQPGPGMGMGPGGQAGTPAAKAPRDCAQAANPAACNAHREARLQAAEKCKAEQGPARRQCMQEQHMKFDCSKAGNPQQCEARKVAYQECKTQTGPAFRQCVQQKMPAVDCSKSANPERCDTHQKAREACKDKIGPEHRSCILQQLNIK